MCGVSHSRGQCIEHNGDHRAEIAHPKQHHHGDQVDKRGQRLQRVHQPENDPTGPRLLRSPNAQGRADQHRDKHGDAAEIKRHHRFAPQAGRRYESHHQHRNNPQLPAGNAPGDQPGRQDAPKPRNTGKEFFHRQQNPFEQRRFDHFQRVEKGDVNPLHRLRPERSSADHPRLRIALHRGGHQPQQECCQYHQKRDHAPGMALQQIASALPPQATLGKGLAGAIQRDSHHHYRQPGLNTAADIKFAQTGQDIESQPASPDH